MFFINIVNDENHPNEHIRRMASAMQAFSYIEDLFDNENHNGNALKVRKKYFKNLCESVNYYIHQ